MGTQLRAGIAGVGFSGALHARSASLAGARLVGIAASTAERAAAAAPELGAERPFDSAEELVGSADIDVVHICTPNYLHLPLVEAAFAAGKHVICEKPLALDAAGARELTEAAAAAGTLAAVPFVYRYYPTVREARERVRAGATGPLGLIHGTYLQDWLAAPGDENWRVEAELGGPSRAFADIGSHWCDLAEFVSGQRISRLSARTATAVPGRGTEDTAVVQFETDRGALGSAIVSQVSPGRKNRLWLELVGAEETLAFDQEHPEELWCGRREAVTVLPRNPATLSPPAARLATLPAGHPQGYADCFEHFVADAYDAIRGGAPGDGLPGFADGLRAALITEAVLASAGSQGWIEVSAADRG
jgi:predicted dehydrogenase